jgi:hypothetical protein
MEAMREARSFMRSQIAVVERDVEAGVAYRPTIDFLQRQNERLAEAERVMREEVPRDRDGRNSYAEAEAIAKDVCRNLSRGRDEPLPWWRIR